MFLCCELENIVVSRLDGIISEMHSELDCV